MVELNEEQIRQLLRGDVICSEDSEGRIVNISATKDAQGLYTSGAESEASRKRSMEKCEATDKDFDPMLEDFFINTSKLEFTTSGYIKIPEFLRKYQGQ